LLLAAQLKRRQIGQALVLHTIERTTLPDPEKSQRVAAALEDAPQALRRPVRDMAPAETASPKPRARSVLQQRANRLLLDAEAGDANPMGEEQ
jgi:hypothetical protein